MHIFRWFRRRPQPAPPDTSRPLSAWQDQVDHVRALMDAFAPPNPTPLDLDKPASEEPTDDHKP